MSAIFSLPHLLESPTLLWGANPRSAALVKVEAPAPTPDPVVPFDERGEVRPGRCIQRSRPEVGHDLPRLKA